MEQHEQLPGQYENTWGGLVAQQLLWKPQKPSFFFTSEASKIVTQHHMSKYAKTMIKCWESVYSIILCIQYFLLFVPCFSTILKYNHLAQNKTR